MKAQEKKFSRKSPPERSARMVESIYLQMVADGLPAAGERHQSPW
ncbi:hypothetical protein [Chromobacterium vaccinii]|nr:hypothetical protein [Chromobacterium vaccinii]